jgi:hypothetical protein
MPIWKTEKEDNIKVDLRKIDHEIGKWMNLKKNLLEW